MKLSDGYEKDYGLNKKVVLYQQAFHCELMYDYLTETGRKVPEWIGGKLSSINQIVAKNKEEKMKKSLSIKREPVKWWKFAERRKTKYEYDEKMELNTLEMELKIAEELKPYHNDLPKMFNELSALCLPSTPCTLENTIPTTKVFIFFGQKTVQFLRDIGILGFLFLFAYILFSLWYANFPKNGMILQALLVCAAGLGACFYSLNEARKYVTSRTFDDKFIPHYYNRITIGIIAGVILANFFNVESLGTKEQGTTIVNLSASLIALLGGFSSDFVVRFLNRLLAMIQTLIEGDAKEIVDSKLEEVKSKNEAERLKRNLENAGSLKLIMNSSDIKPGSDAYAKIDAMIVKMIEGS